MDESQRRIERLEETVASLAREVASLRGVVERIAPAGAASARGEPLGDPAGREGENPFAPIAEPAPATSSAPQPATARPERVPLAPSGAARAGGVVPGLAALRRRPSLDLESLVGRYGTLALSALTILMAVGAFIGWAIANDKIGPGARVGLGALGAAVLAAAGWRLRSRGSVTFGGTLLALALAVVHVVAWGAGPNLHLVPDAAALLVAAVASAALAWLAIRENEESLFAVGVGGALIAPFVTSSGGGRMLPLLAYGFVVIALGLRAVQGRSWKLSTTLLALAAWVYTAAGLAAGRPPAGLAESTPPTLFALAVAWTALALVHPDHRVRVAQAATAGAIAVLVEPAIAGDGWTAAMLAVAVAVTSYAALRLGPVLRGRALLGGLAYPLATLMIAWLAVDDVPRANSVVRPLLGLAWAAAAVFAARTFDARWRGIHLAAAGFASGGALAAALVDHDLVRLAAFAAHGAAFAIVARRTGTRGPLLPAALGLLFATTEAFSRLASRTAYEYTPFLTAPSLVAAVCAAAWLVFSWNASRVRGEPTPDASRSDVLVRVAGGIVAFLWGREELGRAVSPDASTFLLVGYYAAVGVAAIFIGRERRIAALRHVGLLLAILAALKAVAEASGLAIGIRVATYLLAGLFLLAVAYWYRARPQTGDAVGGGVPGADPPAGSVPGGDERGVRDAAPADGATR